MTEFTVLELGDVESTVLVTDDELTDVTVVDETTTIELVDAEPVTIIESGLQGERGPKGDTGDQGPQGDQGIQGPAGGDAAQYTHTQNSPSSTWTITHSLGFYPNVAVTDSAGTVVVGGIRYVDLNTVEVTFSAPFGGSAHLS